MNLPTRIVQQPEYRKKTTKRGGRKTMYCRCDDGHEYELGALSVLLGMSRGGLLKRIGFLGWSHAKVLTANVGNADNLHNGERLNGGGGSLEWAPDVRGAANQEPG